VWDSVADWYIEASKRQNNTGMLAWVLETILTMAHPFLPFTTETIWETLKWEDGLLINASWPEKMTYHEIAAAEFEQLQKLVAEARFVATELPGGRQTLLFEHDTLIGENQELIAHLAKLKEVKNTEQPHGLRLAVPNREAWLEVSEETLYEHQTRLEMRLAETRNFITALEARLANKGYTERAPAAVVEETRTQLGEQKELEDRLMRELQVL